MKENISQISREECVGCNACLCSCSSKAISLIVDRQGFIYPFVDDKKCIKCGKCIRHCPVGSNNCERYEIRNPSKAFAIRTKEISKCMGSTSGGVFSELAEEILRRGGYVCGATFDSRFHVKHIVVNRSEELQKLRKSKYIQSEKMTVFAEIKRLVEDGNQVLFSGTPCEVAGITSFFGKVPDNLYLVDFACAGVNSPQVFQDHLDNISQKYKSSVVEVTFRSKKYGWKNNYTQYKLRNGREIYIPWYKDLFLRGYNEKSIYLRDSCYKCRFKGFPRHSDITLADYWGVETEHPEIDSFWGISAVFENTMKGKRLLDSIQDYVLRTESQAERIINHNKSIIQSVGAIEHQKEFWKLHSTLGYRKAATKLLGKRLLITARREISFIRSRMKDRGKK